MELFSQKLFDEFRKMRLRTRVSVCTRLIMVVFLVIAGLAQIAYST